MSTVIGREAGIPPDQVADISQGIDIEIAGQRIHSHTQT